MKAPCYKCEDRYVKETNGKFECCHSSCEKYAKFIKDYNKEKADIQNARKLERGCSWETSKYKKGSTMF